MLALFKQYKTMFFPKKTFFHSLDDKTTLLLLQISLQKIIFLLFKMQTLNLLKKENSLIQVNIFPFLYVQLILSQLYLPFLLI